MKLNENPIFITQKRLVHRGGVLAAVLIAALIGLSLLAGLVAFRAVPADFRGFNSVQEAGKTFYAWTIAAEILVLVIGGFSRIFRTLAEERKAGLWDSNRLTPLQPAEIVSGYWLGPALREFYMALTLAGTGLVIVVLAELPVTLWLGTQWLIFSAALFFWLIAILAGLSFQRSQIGVLAVLIFVVVQPFSFVFPGFVLTNFLLPSYGIANLFQDPTSLAGNYSEHDWTQFPHFFSLPVPPILFSFALQMSLGILLWRGAMRKTANPFQPLILRSEALAMFGILLVAQHGLIWGLWQGKFPDLAISKHFVANNDMSSLLPVIHCGTFFMALLILAAASPQPETVRVKILRRKITTLGGIFSQSAVSLAMIMGAFASAVLFLHFARSITKSWEIYLIAAGNSVAVLLVFALLFEFCRLHHGRRAVGFLALWLFALCFLPFILAGVFRMGTFANVSLLAPGVTALNSSPIDNLNYLLGIVAAHFCLTLLLWIAWQREWRQLLAKASAS